MARIARRTGAGVRLDAAAQTTRVECDGAVAPGPCRARSDDALRARSGRCGMGCCPRQLQRARQARRRVDRAEPTDRGKPGTKYHVVVATDGIPLAAVPSAANVHDTMLFPGLLRRAMIVCVAIARLYADAAYNSAANRGLCGREGILPILRHRGDPHGSGLGTIRRIVENVNAWLLANKRLDRRNDRLAFIIDALLTAACIWVIANRLVEF